jgi:hypothetical protein
MAKKIKSFDKATAIAFSSELEALTAKLAKKYGISIAVKSRKYGADTYSAKVEVACISSDGTALTKEAKAYDLFASMYGYKVKRGETFVSRGVSYTVTGYNSRARRMPIQAKRCSDGAGFKFTESVVK